MASIAESTSSTALTFPASDKLGESECIVIKVFNPYRHSSHRSDQFPWGAPCS